MNKIKKFAKWQLERHNYRLNYINSCNVLFYLLFSIFEDMVKMFYILTLTIVPVFTIWLWCHGLTVGFTKDTGTFTFTMTCVFAILSVVGAYDVILDSQFIHDIGKFLNKKFCRKIDWYSYEKEQEDQS